MKVFVAGFESSGNRWVRSVLAQHPNLVICGDSFPSGRFADRHYPSVDSGTDCLVIVIRDQTCRRKSVETNQYAIGRESDFSEELNLKALLNAANGIRIVFLSYESALTLKQFYWDNIFAQLGVRPITVSTEYIDGNAKYFSK